MLYWLADFSGTIGVFNVFRYLTVRTGGSMATAALFVFLFGPWIQSVVAQLCGREAPTTDRLMILPGVAVSAVLWAKPTNSYVWIALGLVLTLGLIERGREPLAIAKVMIVACCLGMFCYVLGNAYLADFLQLRFVAGSGELAVVCGAVIGAGLGFLWRTAPTLSGTQG